MLFLSLILNLHVQYSMKILYDPVRIMQNLSSPSIPGSPIQAHDLKYRHSPYTFCRIFRHIVAFTPGKCSFIGSCLQSVIDNVLLSNGSAHFGSESLRHSQHLIAKPSKLLINDNQMLFFPVWMIQLLSSFVKQQVRVLPFCTEITSRSAAAIRRWVLLTISEHFLLDNWES